MFQRDDTLYFSNDASLLVPGNEES